MVTDWLIANVIKDTDNCLFERIDCPIALQTVIAAYLF